MTTRKALSPVRRKKRAKPLVPKRTGKMLCKKGAWKSEKHCLRVRAHGCLIGRSNPKLYFCSGPIDPHHCRKLLPRGNTLPRDDRFVVPLCRKHHDDVTFGKQNERDWWWSWGIDPCDFIRSFSEEGRAALERIERRGRSEIRSRA